MHWLTTLIALTTAIAFHTLCKEAEAANIFSVKCELVIVGPIEATDVEKFQEQLLGRLKSGCHSPKINLYSPGGNLRAAIEIGQQIHFLQLTTVAPTLKSNARHDPSRTEKEPRDGPRFCMMLPGREARAERQREAFKKWSAESFRALKNKTRLPMPPKDYGDFDPKSGIGDPNCACASACFFIWAAGSQRWGDVIQIHRPFFDRKTFSTLNLSDAREAYQKLIKDARLFLTKIGIQTSIVERMFAVDSQSASYLSVEELKSLRMAPYLSELKMAKCGPEPQVETQSNAPDGYPSGEVYSTLSPQQRRWLYKLAKQKICWRDFQKEARRSIIDEYLRTYGH